MTIELDHVLIGSADLDVGVAWVAESTGVTPGGGGVHEGFGTRNAIAGLGPHSYLEVIALDPDQPGAVDALGLGGLVQPRPLTWAVRGDLDQFRAALGSVDIGVEGPIPMSRMTSGVVVEWALCLPVADRLGPVVPFAIDWGTSPHPAADAQTGLTLEQLVLRGPEPDRIQRLLDALQMPAIAVEDASEPGLDLVVSAPTGTTRLTEGM